MEELPIESVKRIRESYKQLRAASNALHAELQSQLSAAQAALQQGAGLAKVVSAHHGMCEGPVVVQMASFSCLMVWIQPAGAEWQSLGLHGAFCHGVVFFIVAELLSPGHRGFFPWSSCHDEVWTEPSW